MRIVTLGLVAAAMLTLPACTSNRMFNANRPDEFAVTRNAPLIVPPDFALVPPAPGQPTPASADSRTQAVEALFGGPAPRSAAETQVLNAAGSDRAATGVRSSVGDPQTNVVDKGVTTRTILSVPQGDGQEARVNTPQ